VLVEAKLLEADAVPMRAAEDATVAVDPRHAEVYDLADEGQSAQEIARQTGRPRGEIELILALRGR
jgi:DNA-binding NarL/FixJ family response regulator